MKMVMERITTKTDENGSSYKSANLPPALDMLLSRSFFHRLFAEYRDTRKQAAGALSTRGGST